MDKMINVTEDNRLLQCGLRFVYFSMHSILSSLFCALLPQLDCSVCRHSQRPVIDEHCLDAYMEAKCHREKKKCS